MLSLVEINVSSHGKLVPDIIITSLINQGNQDYAEALVIKGALNWVESNTQATNAWYEAHDPRML